MSGYNRRSFLFHAASAAGASFSLKSSWTTPEPGIDDISALIDRERRTIQKLVGEGSIEGISVCLLHQGLPVWAEGFGVIDTGGRNVVTDTIFSLQSTSKNLTAVAVLLAVQNGMLDLDEPILKYLPDFTVHSRFEQQPERKITLRLLLSHRAGLTHEAPVGNNYEPAFPNFEAHVQSISRTWLRFPVGERYRYSNLGYDLAGYILQLKTGDPFAVSMQKMLLTPLGMQDATFMSEEYERKGNRAVGHEKGYTTIPLRTPLIPSGGAYVSAKDMIRYSTFHLNHGSIDGRTILRRELWEEMHGFALGGDYGLGGIRTETCYGSTPLRVLSHKGGGFGFGSVFVYCPEAGLAWTALFNRPTDDGYRLGRGLSEDILSKQFGPRQARISADRLPQIRATSRQLTSFAGNYIGRNRDVNIASDGHAITMQEDAASSPIRFTSPTDLFVPDESRDALTYRFYGSTSKEPAHLECFEGELSLDYNHGPGDARGPDESRWNRFVGNYVIYQWGKPALKVNVQIQSGYLALNGVRCVEETRSGLFITADGETVDFREAPPTWKNLRMRRIE